MNILHLTTHFNTGGISSYLLTLNQGLVKEGHRVFLITSGGNLVEQAHTLGIEHITMNIRTKSELDYRIYWAAGWLNRFVKDNQIDVIHAHTRICQVIATCLNRMNGRPNISTCHGFFKPRLSRRMFPCWGKRVIAISEAVYEHLTKDFKIAPSKVDLIKNGIDIANFPILTEKEKQARKKSFGLDVYPVIGIIARLSDVKGHHVLIASMKKIIDHYPKAKLLIIGEGKEEQNLKQQVAALKLQDHVQFYPVVNKTAELLSLFDIFVLPSLQEGLGLSVLEAQAAGLPVVASKIGGLVNLIEDGETGLLVPPDNSYLLAEAVMLLARNKERALEMGQQARRFVQKEYSASSMVNATQELYKKISSDKTN